MPVDDSSGHIVTSATERRFSAQSSIGPRERAQGNRFSIITGEPFPHFHSGGYYYDLYTFIKTG